MTTTTTTTTTTTDGSTDETLSAVTKSNKITLVAVAVDRVRLQEILLELKRGDEKFQNFFKTTGVDPKSFDADSSIMNTSDYVGRLIERPHVTMAHASQVSQQEMHDIFDSLADRVVSVRLTGFWWSDRVAALSVELPDEHLTILETDMEKDGRHDAPITARTAIPACRNVFPHITLWVADGAQAKESNNLPSLHEKGLAERIVWRQTVCIEGVISLW
jgi:hypothetical protein